MAVVDGPVQRGRRSTPGVVAGADRVEAQRERLVEHRRELDLLVAAQARVRRAAGGVLRDEVVDHVRAEPLGQVPDVERDADHVGRAPGVAGVLEGAAAAGAGAERRRVARQRQVHAGDVVAGLDGPGGGDRGVHPAGHRRPSDAFTRGVERRNAIRESTAARRPVGPLDHRADRLDDGVDVGLGGRVPEREPQRPAGQRLGHAHRQQHVARLRDAGRAGRPGRALDAAGVQQQQQGVALAAGEGEVRVAGQAVPGVSRGHR